MSEQVIDTRDLQKRLDELISERDAFVENARELWDEEEDNKGTPFEEDAAKDQWAEENSDEDDELTELEDLSNEVSEWSDGNALIRDDYFTDYCKDMLEDCGTLPKDLPWFIENNINWEGVADDMKADYSESTFLGETYFWRC